MVKFDWFRGYVPGEQPAKFDVVIQSWDAANKSTELSDSVIAGGGCKDVNASRKLDLAAPI
jgi:hypothetical protein